MSLISLAPEEVRAPRCGSVPSHYTPLSIAGEVVLRTSGTHGSQIGYRTSTLDLALGNAAGLE